MHEILREAGIAQKPRAWRDEAGTAERLVRVFQHLGFCALRTQRAIEVAQVGQPLPMQSPQF